MEKRINLDRIPRSLKMKKLGSGYNGTCYLTSDKKVYKEYHTQGIDDEITERLLDLKYDGFTFPEQLVMVDGKLKGFIKEYVAGETMDHLNLKKIKIRDFIKSLKQFENRLQEFSYDTELDVYDLNLHNLLYTLDNEIIDIDTDPIHPFIYPITNPYYENQKELASSLEDMLLKGNFRSHRLQQLQKEILVDGCMKPSVFVSEALDDMYRYAEIETIKDYQEGLVLLRK